MGSRWWQWLVICGCGFHPAGLAISGDATSIGDDAGGSNVMGSGSGTGSACFHASPDVQFLTVCVASAPSGANHPVSQMVNTGSNAPCEPLTSASDPACVISGDTLTIDADVSITASGSRPLVLLATTSIELDGIVDVASYSNGRTGPLADLVGCNVGAAPNHTGGGAGGTWGTKGGDGGDDMNDGGSHGAAGPTIAMQMRGGCRGIDGAGPTGHTGAGGAGGGAVVLIAPTISISGIVDASGAGGGGATGSANSAGGGGGGTGGLIVLSAQSLTVNGSVYANGGGGGAGTAGNDSAGPGTESTGPTEAGLGGLDPDDDGGDGGNGFIAGSNATNGQRGQNNDGGGGGGGGGAGYIHVVHGVMVHGGGTLSPPPQ